MNYFRIKEAAEEANISLTDLARKAGLTWSPFCQMVNGKRWPRLDTLEKVASVLNVKVEDLFATTNNVKEENCQEPGAGETSVFCPHCGKLINIKIQTS